ncbi:hypothetical protein ABXT06_05155 [Flavobacterium sp. UW10123]|uniref:hypothetical protein n=1 Tax=Flavobacterium sp. UW10123 TaxID=3230800 RepID=UPI0033999FB4
MKTKHKEKETKKFDLEKFEVAKLKNLMVIRGGSVDDDPVDTNNTKGGSSRDCAAG